MEPRNRRTTGLSKVGIVCLTSENLNAPWVLYEAGAISKTKDAKVCTLLLDVKPSDVEQPLGQFQHTTRSKDDIKLLLRTINKSVETAGEKVLADSLLDKVFETAWPELSATLEQIAARPSSAESPPRSQVAMLEELLEIMSRYTHRVAISNSRLLALDERGVTFYMEGLPHDGEGALQDHAPRCRRVHAPLPVARPAQRLPPHRIRHYRLLANAGRREHLAQARELLHVVPAKVDPPSVATAPVAMMAPTFVCPHCGAAMSIVETFARGQPIRAPPALRVAA